jgi:hypothetical protein
MPTRKRLIDVSHTVENGMVTYKGLPAPIICDWRSREESRAIYDGAEFQIGKVEMVANTGTYVDSPFHRYAHGKDLSELPLESVADLECLVVRIDPAAGAALDTVPLSARRQRRRCCSIPAGTVTGTDDTSRAPPHRTRGRVAHDGRGRTRRDRFDEHRQHPTGARPVRPARTRHSDRRAPALARQRSERGSGFLPYPW